MTSITIRRVRRIASSAVLAMPPLSRDNRNAATFGSPHTAPSPITAPNRLPATTAMTVRRKVTSNPEPRVDQVVGAAQIAKFQS